MRNTKINTTLKKIGILLFIENKEKTSKFCSVLFFSNNKIKIKQMMWGKKEMKLFISFKDFSCSLFFYFRFNFLSFVFFCLYFLHKIHSKPKIEIKENKKKQIVLTRQVHIFSLFFFHLLVDTLFNNNKKTIENKNQNNIY